MQQNCTNPRQSELLIAAGVNIETADMYYRDGHYYVGKMPESGMAPAAPIWSLAALLDLMPSEIERNGTTYHHVLHKWYDPEYKRDSYEFAYESHFTDEVLVGTINDAGTIIVSAVGLILWLKRNKL